MVRTFSISLLGLEVFGFAHCRGGGGKMFSFVVVNGSVAQRCIFVILLDDKVCEHNFTIVSENENDLGVVG